LDECGACGTEIDLLGIRPTPEIVKVVGYFEKMPDEHSLKSKLKEALSIYGFAETDAKISIREVPERDWLEEWKKHWTETETEKFIVAPSWRELPEEKRIVIRIEPGMAFGTGTHETTRLCLRAIEQNYLPKFTFFDVGTGTGILAIAAAKMQSELHAKPVRGNLSRAKILACDTDLNSVIIARENASLNASAAQIEFYVGSIHENSPEHDFVCANLTADVILPLLPLLLRNAKRFLVMSGILREQESLVAEALRIQGIPEYEVTVDGEWISMVIRK